MRFTGSQFRLKFYGFCYLLRERQKRLQRNELARFYHWKNRNLLVPLNLYKPQF
jgi:hypothetical protein